jgi:hypothetical protein
MVGHALGVRAEGHQDARPSFFSVCEPIKALKVAALKRELHGY